MPHRDIKQVEGELSENSETLDCVNTDHLPRWRRLVIWFCEDEIGFGIASLVAALLVGSPMFFFGLTWLWVIMAAAGGFIGGWGAARRKQAREGCIPPL